MSFITKECNLFQSVNFTSHSGKKLNWKIECDGISNEEWVTIAEMIYEFEPRNFREVEGIPRGGKKLEEKLKGYATGNEHDPLLIVDDVMTTGATVNACAETLKEAGALNVSVWTLARGGFFEDLA